MIEAVFKPNLIKITLLTLFLCKLSTQSLSFTPIALGELFRHGARTGVSNVLSDKYEEKIGKGELTPVGFRQHLLLGMQRRKDYPQIFTARPIRANYELLSSPIRRCKDSANAHLQGLYPEGTGENLPQNFPEQLLKPSYAHDKFTVDFQGSSVLPNGLRLFSVDTPDPSSDQIFWSKGLKGCPLATAKIAAQSAVNGLRYKHFLNPVYERLRKAGISAKKAMGHPFWNPLALGKFYDKLRADLYSTGRLSYGVNPELYNDIERAVDFAWTFLATEEKHLGRFFNTKLLKRLITRFDQIIEGKKPDLKYMLFSGHDTNIFPILLRYGLTSRSCLLKGLITGRREPSCRPAPRFASSFLWELSKGSDGKFYIKSFYDGVAFDFCDGEGKGGYCLYENWKKKHFREVILGKLEFAATCFEPL